MTRPTFELPCDCSLHGHPGTADYSSAPCPWECWQPGTDASVRLRVADLSDPDDRERVVDEFGLTCERCGGSGEAYGETGVVAPGGGCEARWEFCPDCDGRGAVLPTREVAA